MPKRKYLSEVDSGRGKRATTPINQPTGRPTWGSGLAFRISNIPSLITRAEFLQILDRLPRSGAGLADGGHENVLGWSFAPAAASADEDKYRTATVTFKSVPTAFEFPGTSSVIDLGTNTPVIVDKHFHGLTPLSFPVQPTVDIIAVTGLAGHAFGSWKSRGRSDMWLRDFLPEHVPSARILTYGYDSTLFENKSTASIREFSHNFLQALGAARVDIASRPTIFIGHSLGGILIKQAIIQAAESHGENLSIYDCCYGLLLFGVPNLGIEATSLKSMVKGQPNAQLIDDLSLDTHSIFLRRQKFFWEFQIPDNTVVISIYETKPTPTAQETLGVWRQDGPEVLMVSMESATAATPVANQDDIFSIDQNHSNIVKFKNRTCPDYINVRSRLISLVQYAPAVISKRLMDQRESREIVDSGERVNSSMRSVFMQFRGDIQEQKKLNILAWLSKIEHITHHQHASEGMLENTGQWLLNSWQFREWRTVTKSSILWLHGIPGAGKTKLTCTVIETLRSLLQNNGPSSYQTHEPVVYFYCNQNEPDRRDPTKIMQSLVKQMSLVLPAAGLPKPVIAEYEKRVKDGLASGSLEFRESKDLLVSLLHIFPRTTIIIDALDESDPLTRGRLLETLTALMHSSTFSVKLFISSREDVDIKLKLETVPNLYIEAQNSADIERFIHREIGESIENGRLLNLPDEVRKQIIDTLVNKAGGMFQWVNLQLKYLAGMKFQQDIVENLGKLPRSLHATYSRILTAMRESANGREWEVTRRALMWIMCSGTLLTKHLWTEMTYWPIPVPEDGADILFELCQNLVTLDSRSSMVRFAHLSVQEYLESDREFISVASNSMAVVYCLSQLDTSQPYLHIDHQPWRGNWYGSSGISSGQDYASRYWTGHMERVYDCDQTLDRDVLGKLKHFILPASPAYGNWVKSIERWAQYSKTWQEIRSHLRSTPTNPLFLAACFRFGGLGELWECNALNGNVRNDNGESPLFVAIARGNEPVVEILFEKGVDIYWENDTQIYDPLIVKILHLKGGLGLAASLIDKCTSVIGLEKALEISVAYGNETLVKLVIDRYPSLMLTESIATAAARNKRYGKEMMWILLDRDTNLPITEAVVAAAAGNERYGNVLMSILLARDTNIPITEAVVTAAAGNEWYGIEILSMLLARDTNILITEAVVAAAAGNWRYGIEILSMLLDRDTNIPITEAVMTAAAGNERYGIELLSMLLDRDRNIPITEAVLTAAVGNWRYGNVLMLMLLDRDTNMPITEAVVTAAAGNEWYGIEILSMLLARDRNIPITEAVVTAAAGNWWSGKKIMSTLLDRNPNIPITPDVMAVIEGNTACGVKIMSLLSARGRNMLCRR